MRILLVHACIANACYVILVLKENISAMRTQELVVWIIIEMLLLRLGKLALCNFLFNYLLMEPCVLSFTTISGAIMKRTKNSHHCVPFIYPQYSDNLDDVQ